MYLEGKAMRASATVGRPKIEGLVSVNLRLLEADLAALDRIVEAEREKRHDPGFTRTDLIRELVGAYVRKNEAKK